MGQVEVKVLCIAIWNLKVSQINRAAIDHRLRSAVCSSIFFIKCNQSLNLALVGIS